MLSFVALPVWEFTRMDWCCWIFRVMMVICKAKKWTVLVFHFYLLLFNFLLPIFNYRYLRVKSNLIFLMIRWFYASADCPVKFKFSSLQLSDFRRKIVVPQLLGTWLVLVPLAAWKLSNFTSHWTKCKPLSSMLYLHYPCALPFPVILLVTWTEVSTRRPGWRGCVELGQARRPLRGWGRSGISPSSVTMASASWSLSCCTQLIL